MLRFLSLLWRQLSDTYASMPMGRRVGSTALLFGVIAGFIAIIFWAGRPDFQVLYTNLSSEDAASIVTTLKEQDIPYRISRGGEVVLVPSERVYDTRMSLATEGLPRGGGVGFEVFDKRTLGMTEFEQQLNYKRSLQGELSRTVNRIYEVAQSRVHIVLPKPTAFLEKDEQQASASVFLNLRPGRRLGNAQVQGIVHLVASAVEGLQPNRVTVVDNHGNVLSRVGDEDTPARLAGNLLEFQRGFEKDLQGKIEKVIGKVVGPGKVIAQVAADLDLRQEEKTLETFDPDTAAIRSQQRFVEKSSDRGGGAGGVPGVQSNVPGAQAGAAAETGGQTSFTERTEETVNYEISKVTSKVVQPLGGVKKLSVAVVVDGTYQTKQGEGGKIEKAYQARTQEELQQFTQIVRNVVGFNEARGDQITVQSIPFETGFGEVERELMEQEQQKRFWFDVGKHVGIGLIVIIALLVVLRPLIRWLTAAPLVAPGQLPAARRPPQVPGVARAELEGAPPDVLEEPEDEGIRVPTTRDRVLTIARRDAAGTADMLRAWIREREQRRS